MTPYEEKYLQSIREQEDFDARNQWQPVRSLRSGLESLKGSFQGTGAAIARVVGADETAEEWEKKARVNQAQAAGLRGAVPQLHEAEGIGDYARIGTDWIFSNLPLMAATLPLGGVGGVAGKAVLGARAGKAAQAAGKTGAALDDAIRAGQATGMKRGAMAGAFVPYAGTTIGESYNRFLNDPDAEGSPTQKAALAIGTGTAMGALGVAGVERVLHGLTAGRGALYGIGTAAVGEGVTETGEQVIQRGAHGLLNPEVNLLDQDARREYIEAFLAGATVGGTVSGVSHMAMNLMARGRGEQPPGQEPPPATEERRWTPDPIDPQYLDANGAPLQGEALRQRVLDLEAAKNDAMYIPPPIVSPVQDQATPPDDTTSEALLGEPGTLDESTWGKENDPRIWNEGQPLTLEHKLRDTSEKPLYRATIPALMGDPITITERDSVTGQVGTYEVPSDEVWSYVKRQRDKAAPVEQTEINRLVRNARVYQSNAGVRHTITIDPDTRLPKYTQEAVRERPHPIMKKYGLVPYVVDINNDLKYPKDRKTERMNDEAQMHLGVLGAVVEASKQGLVPAAKVDNKYFFTTPEDRERLYTDIGVLHFTQDAEGARIMDPESPLFKDINILDRIGVLSKRHGVLDQTIALGGTGASTPLMIKNDAEQEGDVAIDGTIAVTDQLRDVGLKQVTTTVMLPDGTIGLNKGVVRRRLIAEDGTAEPEMINQDLQLGQKIPTDGSLQGLEMVVYDMQPQVPEGASLDFQMLVSSFRNPERFIWENTREMLNRTLEDRLSADQFTLHEHGIPRSWMEPEVSPVRASKTFDTPATRAMAIGSPFLVQPGEVMVLPETFHQLEAAERKRRGDPNFKLKKGDQVELQIVETRSPALADASAAHLVTFKGLAQFATQPGEKIYQSGIVVHPQDMRNKHMALDFDGDRLTLYPHSETLDPRDGPEGYVEGRDEHIPRVTLKDLITGKKMPISEAKAKGKPILDRLIAQLPKDQADSLRNLDPFSRGLILASLPSSDGLSQRIGETVSKTTQLLESRPLEETQNARALNSPVAQGVISAQKKAAEREEINNLMEVVADEVRKVAEARTDKTGSTSKFRFLTQLFGEYQRTKGQAQKKAQWEAIVGHVAQTLDDLSRKPNMERSPIEMAMYARVLAVNDIVQAQTEARSGRSDRYEPLPSALRRVLNTRVQQALDNPATRDQVMETAELTARIAAEHRYNQQMIGNLKDADNESSEDFMLRQELSKQQKSLKQQLALAYESGLVTAEILLKFAPNMAADIITPRDMQELMPYGIAGHAEGRIKATPAGEAASRGKGSTSLRLEPGTYEVVKRYRNRVTVQGAKGQFDIHYTNADAGWFRAFVAQASAFKLNYPQTVEDFSLVPNEIPPGVHPRDYRSAFATTAEEKHKRSPSGEKGIAYSTDLIQPEGASSYHVALERVGEPFTEESSFEIVDDPNKLVLGQIQREYNGLTLRTAKATRNGVSLVFEDANGDTQLFRVDTTGKLTLVRGKESEDAVMTTGTESQTEGQPFAPNDLGYKLMPHELQQLRNLITLTKRHGYSLDAAKFAIQKAFVDPEMHRNRSIRKDKAREEAFERQQRAAELRAKREELRAKREAKKPRVESKVEPKVEPKTEAPAPQPEEAEVVNQNAAPEFTAEEITTRLKRLRDTVLKNKWRQQRGLQQDSEATDKGFEVFKQNHEAFTKAVANEKAHITKTQREVNRIRQQLGLPNITAVSYAEALSHVDRASEAKLINLELGYTSGLSWVDDKGHLRIWVNPTLKDTARAGIIGHEVGHHVMNTKLAGASIEVQNAIIRDYAKFLADKGFSMEGYDPTKPWDPVTNTPKADLSSATGAATFNDLLAATLPLSMFDAQQFTNKNSLLSTLVGSKNHAKPRMVEYQTLFKEWFANQIARELEMQAIEGKSQTQVKGGKLSAVRLFIQDVITALKKLYAAIGDITGFKPAPSITDFVSQLQTRAAYEHMKNQGLRAALKPEAMESVGKRGPKIPEHDKIMEAAYTAWAAASQLGVPQDLGGLAQAFNNYIQRAKLDPKLYETMKRAAMSPTMQNRMLKLFEHDLETSIAIRSSPEAAVGYLYALSRAKLIPIGPETTKAFNAYTEALTREWKKARGTLEDYTDLEDLLAKLEAGDFNAPPVTFVDPSAKGTKAVRRAMIDGLAKVWGGFYDTLYKPLMHSPMERLRATRSPTLQRLADIIASDPVARRGAMASYMSATNERFGYFSGLVDKALTPLSNDEALQKEAWEHLNLLKKSTNPAVLQVERDLQAVFKRMYLYGHEHLAELGFEERKNYWPMTFDEEKARRDYDGLIKAVTPASLEKHWTPLMKKWLAKLPAADKALYKDITWQEFANERMRYTVEEGAETSDEHVHNPGFRYANPRDLDFLRTAPELSEAEKRNIAEYFKPNVAETVLSYTKSIVRRTEYAKRFGAKGEKLEAMLDKAKTEGATDADIQFARDFLNAVNGLYGRRTKDWINGVISEMWMLSPETRERLTDKSKGTVHKGVSAFNDVNTTYQNWRILTTSVFSSFVDPLGIGVRSSDALLMLRSQRAAAQAMFQGIEKSELLQWADLLNTISARMQRSDLANTYGYHHMGRWARKWNDTLFKYNGVEQLTKYTRLAGTHAASEFLLKHKDGKHKDSARFLSELGVKPEDIQRGSNGLVKLMTEAEILADEAIIRDKKASKKVQDAAKARLDADMRVREAIFQFVDGASVRPDPSKIPLWMSDGHFQVFSHLKQFLHGFHHTIVNRVYSEALEHKNYAPAILMVATFIPMMLFADWLRDWLKHGEEGADYKQDWTTADYIHHAVARAGFYGRDELLWDVAEQIMVGDIPRAATEALGPTASQIRTVMTYGPSARDLPTQDLWRNWN